MQGINKVECGRVLRVCWGWGLVQTQQRSTSVGQQGDTGDGEGAAGRAARRRPGWRQRSLLGQPPLEGSDHRPVHQCVEVLPPAGLAKLEWGEGHCVKKVG